MKLKTIPLLPRLAALAALLLVCALPVGCGGQAPASQAPEPEAASQAAETEPTPNESEPAASGAQEDAMIEITMENGGVIKLQLDSEAAPITVENFVKLANEGYYDGLTFHRVMEGFMIQGGCPDGTGTGNPGYSIKGEFASNGWDNPISHTRGVISMARSGGDPDSAGSQFFITNADATFLDGDYAAFGAVVDGMDVVDEISAVDKRPDARGELSVPVEPVVIKTVRVVEA